MRRLRIYLVLRRGGITRRRAFQLANGLFGAKRVVYITETVYGREADREWGPDHPSYDEMGQ